MDEHLIIFARPPAGEHGAQIQALREEEEGIF